MQYVEGKSRELNIREHQVFIRNVQIAPTAQSYINLSQTQQLQKQ